MSIQLRSRKLRSERRPGIVISNSRRWKKNRRLKRRKNRFERRERKRGKMPNRLKNLRKSAKGKKKLGLKKLSRRSKEN